MTGGVVTLGETMGLFVAEAPGPLTHIDAFRLRIGGADSNVAIGLARLGTPSSWIGRVGADEVGARVQRELRAEGVTTHVVVDNDWPTGLMVKSRPIANVVRVAYHRAGSAGSHLEPKDIPAALVQEAALLHVTGITPAISATAAAAVDHAIDLAVAAGVPVSFDVNHRAALWSSTRAAAVYRSIAARASVIFAGEDEARILVDGDSPEALARALAKLGPAQAVVKLGAEGCIALVDGELHSAAAIAVEVVDTVGAGDAFVAGYLAELCAGAPVATRLDTAVRCGAFACLGEGDWESFATREALTLLDGGDPVIR